MNTRFFVIMVMLFVVVNQIDAMEHGSASTKTKMRGVRFACEVEVRYFTPDASETEKEAARAGLSLASWLATWVVAQNSGGKPRRRRGKKLEEFTKNRRRAEDLQRAKDIVDQSKTRGISVREPIEDFFFRCLPGKTTTHSMRQRM